MDSNKRHETTVVWEETSFHNETVRNACRTKQGMTLAMLEKLRSKAPPEPTRISDPRLCAAFLPLCLHDLLCLNQSDWLVGILPFVQPPPSEEKKERTKRERQMSSPVGTKRNVKKGSSGKSPNRITNLVESATSDDTVHILLVVGERPLSHGKAA